MTAYLIAHRPHPIHNSTTPAEVKWIVGWDFEAHTDQAAAEQALKEAQAWDMRQPAHKRLDFSLMIISSDC
jgi:hypothetical protein